MPDSSAGDLTPPPIKENDPEANDPGVTDTDAAALEDHAETLFEIQTLHKDLSQSAETAIATHKKIETPENDPGLRKACNHQTESVTELKEIEQKLEVVQQKIDQMTDKKPKAKGDPSLRLTNNSPATTTNPSTT